MIALLTGLFALMNYQGTCTLDSYVSCELVRLQYPMNIQEKISAIHSKRDALRSSLAIPYTGLSIPYVWDRLQARGLIQGWYANRSYTNYTGNSVLVYYEEEKNVNHASCIVGEDEENWILAGSKMINKNSQYMIYTYLK